MVTSGTANTNQPIENRLIFNRPTCYPRLAYITCTTKLINTVAPLVKAHLDFCTSKAHGLKGESQNVKCKKRDKQEGTNAYIA